MKKKFIDLFSGTGAFTYVLKKYYECVFANDMIKESQQIYEENNINNKHFVMKDLNDIIVDEIPKHDILCGGFPCQPFSIAGMQKGFEDKRSNVFWKILEILEYHKPELIILENVKNLVSHKKGETFKIIKSKLEEIGYNIKYKILDTSKITNIPHHRERIYIIGFLDKKKFNKNIVDYLETNINEKFYYTNKLKVYNTIKNNVKKHISTNTVYQYRRYYVRENKSNCCPTLTANMGSGGHNVPLIKDDNGIRKLTPRECFNLQGFPITYKLPNISNTKLYKLSGNAVSIPIIELIMDKLSLLI